MKIKSKSEIISKIISNKPSFLELSELDVSFFLEDINLFEEFKKNVEIVGGNVLEAISDEMVEDKVKVLFPNSKINISTSDKYSNFNTIDLSKINKPQVLENLDVVILKSDFAVAENGSVWLSDEQLPIRVLPFITKHLVVVLKKDNIVPLLHQAYDKLDSQDNGYGVFISGPSKTADIEQSLVIGAHGSLSFTLFVIN